MQEPLLQRRDVLVLVDDEEAVLLSHALGHPRLQLEHADGRQQDVLEVHLPALVLDVLVGLQQGERRVVTDPLRQRARGPQLDRVLLERQLAHLAPLDLGRHVPHTGGIEAQADALPDSAISLPLPFTIAGAGPPTVCGQKKPSWLRAAAWNVRAATPDAPRSRRRPRNSPAAFDEKVSARTRDGSYTPERMP